MNGYELIRKLQAKMQDPNFARRFNQLAQQLNNNPVLQQEIMRIAQMNSDKERQKAIKRLPENVKNSVSELLQLLNN